MKTKSCLSFILISVLSLTAGCSVEALEEERVSEERVSAAVKALITNNELTPNALNPNALNPNALIPNALIPNALIPNELDPDALTAIKNPGTAGALSRQFMKYLIGCAFDSTQTFNFSWVDSNNVTHNESYQGSLGLATFWQDEPLCEDSQLRISACMIARTNYYGTQVTISIREYDQEITPTSESGAYTKLEGAFYGNLFSETPELYACYNSANRSYARSKMRDCAAGHVGTGNQIQECGAIHIVGDCEDYCSWLTQDGLVYPSCSNEDSSLDTSRVFTTYLQ